MTSNRKRKKNYIFKIVHKPKKKPTVGQKYEKITHCAKCAFQLQ